jgi:hypothetical protein
MFGSVWGEVIGDDPDDGLNALWIKLFLFSKNEF